MAFNDSLLGSTEVLTSVDGFYWVLLSFTRVTFGVATELWRSSSSRCWFDWSVVRKKKERRCRLDFAGDGPRGGVLLHFFSSKIFSHRRINQKPSAGGWWTFLKERKKGRKKKEDEQRLFFPESSRWEPNRPRWPERRRPFTSRARPSTAVKEKKNLSSMCRWRSGSPTVEWPEKNRKKCSKKRNEKKPMAVCCFFFSAKVTDLFKKKKLTVAAVTYWF